MDNYFKLYVYSELHKFFFIYALFIYSKFLRNLKFIHNFFPFLLGQARHSKTND